MGPITSSRFYESFGKRALDIAITAPGLIGLSPVFACVGLAVRTQLGSPVFFCQERPGLHGRPFKMWKFRTMTNERGPDGTLLPDAERLTPLGRFLRSSSLDELPELVNVLLGDMSLVGPRPLLMRYLERYSPEQARRNETRPGITGLAQVNGRNGVSWDDRLEMDVLYVDGCSFALDLKILYKTIATVLKREGIHASDHATMPEFMGSAA